MFNESCAAGLRYVTRSAWGCRWAINEWEKLAKQLAEDGTWYGQSRLAAIQLQGVSACLPELYLSEEAYGTWRDCLVAQPNPKQKDIDRILDPQHVPKALQERDVTLWPGNAAQSRARLQALVDRELPRLRALEETLRVQYEEPARAEAKDMALANVTRDEMVLIRAERIYEQSYVRAVNALMKVRKQSAASPVRAGREVEGSMPILGDALRRARSCRPSPSIKRHAITHRAALGGALTARELMCRGSRFHSAFFVSCISGSSAESVGGKTEEELALREKIASWDTRSVKMELPRFIKTRSAPGCVSRRSSIAWRSSSRLSTARRAWRSRTMGRPWWSRSSRGRTVGRFVPGCGRPGPAYDRLEERRFEFVPVWGILVFLAYRMRRVDCKRCGVTVEMVPWCDGKNQLTTTYRWFLATWAKRLSWSEVGSIFRTSWDSVCRAVEHAVEWGLAHRDLSELTALGMDEIAWAEGTRT